jgi:phage terminase large subunit
VEKKFSELSGFQPKQRLAEKTLFSDDCKYLLYGGAVGGGKSYWLRWTALQLALYYYSKYGVKGVTIGLFSEDYPTLKDRQISRIALEFPSWLGELKTTQIDGLAFHLYDNFGGGKILLRNLDDPSKYASSEFAAIGVEELTKNDRAMFDALRHRLRFPGITDTKFFAATNPGGKGHAFCKSLWVEMDSGDPEQELFKYIPASYRDNKYIDTESYERQLMGLPDELRKALMEGDWDLIAGQAFSELSRNIHIISPIELPIETRYFAGYDHGFNHPFSFVLFAVVPDGTVYVTKHITARLKRPDEIVKMIMDSTKHHGQIDIYAGHDCWSRQRDGSPTVVEQLRNAGLDRQNKYSILKARIDRIQGAAEVRKWLAWKNTESEKPKIFIFENAIDVYDTLSYMQFDEKKPEDVMKMDADVNGLGGDDAYDSFRYGLMSRAYPPKIEEEEYPKDSAMHLIEQHLKNKEAERMYSQW